MVQTILDTFTVKNNPPANSVNEAGSPAAWNDLGNSLVRVGAFNEAIQAFKQAIDIDPGYGVTYSNLANLCTLQGKLAEAVTLSKKSIRLLNSKKDKALTWARLGEAYRQLGQYELAMSAYQTADELNETDSTAHSEFRAIPIGQVVAVNLETATYEGDDELLASVRAHGIIQPVIVCPAKGSAGSSYLLIAGRRRLKAAIKLGLNEIPAIIRQATQQEMLELSINENSHRRSLNDIELAESYQALETQFNLPLDELAQRVAKSAYQVNSLLSLLDLPQDLKQALKSGQINQEQARLLIQLPTEIARQFALQHIIKDDLNIGQTEDLIFRMNNTNPTAVDGRPTGRIFEPSDSFDDEPETENAPTEEHRGQGNNSLVSRARFLLKSNPHGERSWNTPAYRA